MHLTFFERLMVAAAVAAAVYTYSTTEFQVGPINNAIHWVWARGAAWERSQVDYASLIRALSVKPDVEQGER